MIKADPEKFLAIIRAMSEGKPVQRRERFGDGYLEWVTLEPTDPAYLLTPNFRPDEWRLVPEGPPVIPQPTARR